jgi:hypothetical protein
MDTDISPRQTPLAIPAYFAWRVALLGAIRQSSETGQEEAISWSKFVPSPVNVPGAANPMVSTRAPFSVSNRAALTAFVRKP